MIKSSNVSQVVACRSHRSMLMHCASWSALFLALLFWQQDALSKDDMAPGFGAAKSDMAPGFANSRKSEDGEEDNEVPAALKNKQDDKSGARVDAFNSIMKQVMDKKAQEKSDGKAAEDADVDVMAAIPKTEPSEFDKEPEPVKPVMVQEEQNVPPPALPALGGSSEVATAPLPALEHDLKDDSPAEKKSRKVTLKKKRMPTHNYRTQYLPHALFTSSSLENRKLPKPLQWSQLDREMFKAARAGNVDVMRALYGRGVSVTSYNQQGESLLSLAVRYQRVAAVHWLVVHGARVNDANAQGQTPLHAAIAQGNVAITQILLDAGADPHVVDANGAGAAQFAVSSGNPSISALLQHYGVL